MRLLLSAFVVLAMAAPAVAEQPRRQVSAEKIERAADATPAANQARAPIQPPPAAHPGESPRAESLFTGPPPLPLQA